MPKKSVALVSGGLKRWKTALEVIAARRLLSVTKVANEVITSTIETLEATAPYTHGQLLGKPALTSAIPKNKKYAIPFSKRGFRKFRQQKGGKRTFVIANAAWGLYGKGLETGYKTHNPALGGRSWQPGFARAAIALAKARAIAIAKKGK